MKELDEIPLYRHPHPHRELYRRYAHCMQRNYLGSLALSLLTFLIGIGVNYFAAAYATESASNSVTDIILSNTPVYEVDGLFVYGAVVLIVFIALVCFVHPKRFPFVLYSLGIFYLIRGGFVSLTHLGSFPYHTPINFTSSIGKFLSKLFFGDDLFFSGHTGAPFLMALVFWRDKILRYAFIAWSIFFAAVVLLGHIHYSIDVASAFFITYGIFHIAVWLYPRAWALFISEEPLY